MMYLLKYSVHRLCFFIAASLILLTKKLFGSTSTTRSLWSSTPILNMAINAKAERLLGVEADSFVYNTYFITEAFTYNLDSIGTYRPIRFILSYIVFIWACLKYKRFHFYCDRGLLPPLNRFCFNPDELWFLHYLNKQIFFWTYGADVRCRDTTMRLGKFNNCIDCQQPGIACVCVDDVAEKKYKLLRKYATAIFSMGDMNEYTPGSRNDLFFWPVDLDAEDGKKYAPIYPSQSDDKPLRLVHAPNHRHFKGTKYLVNACVALKSKGVLIDLVLVEGVPNDRALEIYRSADVVFDQCINGFHGYFANEAMALGKPVLVFIRKPEEYLIAPEECPFVNITPETLADTIEKLAKDRTLLHELGVRGRKYVEKYLTMSEFAKRLERSYSELNASFLDQNY